MKKLALIIILAFLVVLVNAASNPLPKEATFKISPLNAKTDNQIGDYAIAYANTEFHVLSNPKVVQTKEITGDDLAKIGVYAWGNESHFFLVILQGSFDVTSKWPNTSRLVNFLAFVFDPNNGLAAFMTDSPNNMNILSGTIKLDISPLSINQPDLGGPTAVPNNENYNLQHGPVNPGGIEPTSVVR
jgi:hypothetical protein